MAPCKTSHMDRQQGRSLCMEARPGKNENVLQLPYTKSIPKASGQSYQSALTQTSQEVAPRQVQAQLQLSTLNQPLCKSPQSQNTTAGRPLDERPLELARPQHHILQHASGSQENHAQAAHKPLSYRSQATASRRLHLQQGLWQLLPFSMRRQWHRFHHDSSQQRLSTSLEPRQTAEPTHDKCSWKEAWQCQDWNPTLECQVQKARQPLRKDTDDTWEQKSNFQQVSKQDLGWLQVELRFSEKEKPKPAALQQELQQWHIQKTRQGSQTKPPLRQPWTCFELQCPFHPSQGASGNHRPLGL